MLIRFLFALAILILLYLGYKKLQSLPPAERRRTIWKWMVYGIIAAILLAVATGKMHWLGAVVAALLGFAKIGLNYLMRLLPFINLVRRNQPFGNPVFRTEYLEARLDLQSGTITGRILQGPHAGKNLADLTVADLQELCEYYHELDKRSYFLIRVLQQRAGAKAQDEQHHYSTAGNPSTEEALMILGLKGRPSKQDIVKAHKVLIQKLHPDRGGNDYLASRVNVAKDVLMKAFGYSSN